MAPGARQCFLEPRLVERLEQEVEGVNFECFQCMVVVRRHEHDRRGFASVPQRSFGIAALQGLDDVEAVDIGHLHVEEDQVGILIVDGAQRFGAVRTLGNDLDVVVLSEERPHALARELFVVDDRDANLVRIGNQSAAVRSREW